MRKETSSIMERLITTNGLKKTIFQKIVLRERFLYISTKSTSDQIFPFKELANIINIIIIITEWKNASTDIKTVPQLDKYQFAADMQK